MKKIGWSGILFASLSFRALGQVTVEVGQTQDQFLPGESVPVAVRITNQSGQTLHLGDEDDWLTFSVEGIGGTVVPKLGEVPVRGAFDLESSGVATKRVDLAPYFPLLQRGRYTVTAMLKIRGWNSEIPSRGKTFDVIEGVNLWEQEFGLPEAAGGTNANPEIRRYCLRQASYLRELRLYLRVTDQSGTRPVRVVPIGVMLSFSRPEHRIDKHSNLHVLYQSGPQSFSYTVYNPDGDLITRQTHDYVRTRPRLQVDADGNPQVVGGEAHDGQRYPAAAGTCSFPGAQARGGAGCGARDETVESLLDKVRKALHAPLHLADHRRGSADGVFRVWPGKILG